MYFRHQVEAMRVQFLWFAANHAKQDHCSVPLCSNNRSKGKLAIAEYPGPAIACVGVLLKNEVYNNRCYCYSIRCK